MKATLGSALRMGLISAALLLSGSVAQALDLFWTNENTNTIQGSNLDGTGFSVLNSLSGTPQPYDIAIVPEPSTYALMLGLVGTLLFAFARRHLKSKAQEII